MTNVPIFLSNYRLQLQSDAYRESTREWQTNGANAITWREQHDDPIFQFCELVAGSANASVYDFLVDDADDEYQLEERTVIKNYAMFRDDLQKTAAGLRPYLLARVELHDMAKHSAGEVTVDNVQDFERAVVALNVPRGGAPWRPIAVRTFYCPDSTMLETLRALQQQKRAHYECCMRDIALLTHKIEEMTARKKPRPWSVLQEAQAQVRALHVTVKAESTAERTAFRTFFSNEMFFKPSFAWAVSMAQQKLNARCGSGTCYATQEAQGKQLRDLMTKADRKVLFAQLVALQHLIAKSRNPKGEWVKDIAYKRLIRSENTLMCALRRVVSGGFRRGTLLGYDSVGGDLF